MAPRCRARRGKRPRTPLHDLPPADLLPPRLVGPPPPGGLPLLELVRTLPTDTKAGVLAREIARLRAEGYAQVMVFTQYTDTLDFLREQLSRDRETRVLCFSGRGGEQRTNEGA